MPTITAQEVSSHRAHVAALLAERGRLIEDNKELRARALHRSNSHAHKALVPEHFQVTHHGALVHEVPKPKPGEAEEEKAEKWSTSAGTLWPKPRAIRDGDVNDLDYQHERDMTWSELFFDLIFVVAIARLGEQLKDESATDIDFAGYIFYFYCYWGVWYQAAVYGNQFGTNDLPNMLFFSVVMGCVVFMTIHVKGGETGPRVQGFAASAGAANLAVFLQNLRILLQVDSSKGRGSGRLALFRSTVHCLFYFSAAALCNRIPLFAFRMFQCCFFYDMIFMRLTVFFLPRASRFFHWIIGSGGMLPFHLEHINERIGLLIIIFLGDNVDNVTSSFSQTYSCFFTVLASFVLIVCLKTLFFDVDDDDIDNHAIRRSVGSAITWWNSVSMLCLGVSLFGNGLSLVCAHVAGKNKGPAEDRQFIVCYGLALALFAMTIQALSHKREWHDAAKLETVPKLPLLMHLFKVQQVSHLAASAAICALPRLGIEDELLMGILLAIGVALVALNLADEVIELKAFREEEVRYRVANAPRLEALPRAADA